MAIVPTARAGASKRTSATRRCASASSRTPGAAPGNGGGFHLTGAGNVLIESTRVRWSTASAEGGGLLNNRGTAMLTDTLFAGNDAQREGGGVEALEGKTNLVNVRLENNNTGPMPSNGGGLHLIGAGLVTLLNGKVTGNSASNEGGGLWNSGTGQMFATSVVIEMNTAPKGPNVFNLGGTSLVDGTPVPVLP